MLLLILFPLQLPAQEMIYKKTLAWLKQKTTRTPIAAKQDRATHWRQDRVALGLGGNIGDRYAMLEKAIQAIKAIDDTDMISMASLYESEPWGDVNQPKFLNTACVVRTRLTPNVLFEALQTIEKNLGREKTRRWGPRVIDIDILTWEGVTLSEAHLTIPHKHLLERAFVLAPLAEILPDLKINNKTVVEHLFALPHEERNALIQLD